MKTRKRCSFGVWTTCERGGDRVIVTAYKDDPNDPSGRHHNIIAMSLTDARLEACRRRAHYETRSKP